MLNKKSALKKDFRGIAAKMKHHKDEIEVNEFWKIQPMLSYNTGGLEKMLQLMA